MTDIIIAENKNIKERKIEPDKQQIKIQPLRVVECVIQSIDIP